MCSCLDSCITEEESQTLWKGMLQCSFSIGSKKLIKLTFIKGTDDAIVCLKRDLSNTFEHDDVQMNGQIYSFFVERKKSSHRNRLF